MDHSYHLLQCVQILKNHQVLCDVCLQCNGETVMAHRIVLMSFSKLLATKLLNSMMDEQAMTTIDLDLYNIAPVILKNLVYFMYHGQFEDMTYCKEIYIGAMKLQMDAAKYFIESYVEKVNQDIVLEKYIKSEVDNDINAIENDTGKTIFQLLDKIWAYEPSVVETGANYIPASDIVPKISSQELVASVYEKYERPDYFTDDDDTKDFDEDEPDLSNVSQEMRRSKRKTPQSERNKETSIIDEDQSVFIKKEINQSNDDFDIHGEEEDHDHEPQNIEFVPPVKRKRGRPRKSDTNMPTKTKGTVTPKAKAQTKKKESDGELGENQKSPKTIERFKHCLLEDGTYQCTFCSFNSPKYKVFAKHITSEHEEEVRPYHCDMCDKTFKQSKHLKAHLRTHSDARPYVCVVCSATFKDPKHLSRHMKLHTGEKPHACTEPGCEQRFLDRDRLRRHVDTIHKNKRPFACDHPGCSYRAYSNKTLEMHKVRHLPMEERDSVICDICGKELHGVRSIKLHMLIHTGPDLHCKECDYTSKFKGAMKSHMLRLHGIDFEGNKVSKQFMCELCGYETYYPTDFNFHMLRHSGERPHKCPMCDFDTNDKGTLKIHMRGHTGETPYKCNFCDNAYTNKSALVRHQRNHTGQKPYKCDQCDAAYGDKKNLLAHSYKHTGIKPFPCKLCAFATVKKHKLDLHIRETHGPEHLPKSPKGYFVPKIRTDFGRKRKVTDETRVFIHTQNSKDDSEADSINRSMDSGNLEDDSIHTPSTSSKKQHEISGQQVPRPLAQFSENPYTNYTSLQNVSIENNSVYQRYQNAAQEAAVAMVMNQPTRGDRDASYEHQDVEAGVRVLPELAQMDSVYTALATRMYQQQQQQQHE